MRIHGIKVRMCPFLEKFAHHEGIARLSCCFYNCRNAKLPAESLVFIPLGHGVIEIHAHCRRCANDCVDHFAQISPSTYIHIVSIKPGASPEEVRKLLERTIALLSL